MGEAVGWSTTDSPVNWVKLPAIPFAMVVIGVSAGWVSKGSCNWMALFSIKKKAGQSASLRVLLRKTDYLENHMASSQYDLWGCRIL